MLKLFKNYFLISNLILYIKPVIKFEKIFSVCMDTGEGNNPVEVD